MNSRSVPGSVRAMEIPVETLAQVSTIPYASMQGALFLLSHLIFAVLQVIFAVLSHVLEIYNVLFPSH